LVEVCVRAFKSGPSLFAATVEVIWPCEEETDG
jgi:hypothetical protein